MEGIDNLTNDDVQAFSEMDCIAKAITDSMEFGLQVEVFHTALRIMKDHPELEISNVVRGAMIEWDVW